MFSYPHIKQKKCLITLMLAFVLSGAPMAGVARGIDGHDTPAVTLSVNKSIFVPGDTMRISVGVTASRVDADVVDVHVVVRQPDGAFSTWYYEPRWTVVDKPLYEIASIPLQNKRIGPYTWYFVLCPPGSDLFDIRSWITSALSEVYILPDNDASLHENRHTLSFFDADRPVLIAHAGGEFQGRVGQNSREALDKNYAKGYRFFEIDLNWTSDSRLVLIHDWQAAFSGLFADAKERPSLERFESMKMKYGMTQMSLGALFHWLSRHDQARIITDVKERNLPALRTIAMNAGGLKKRFIPQIYEPSEFKPVTKLGFKDVILTLYRSSLSDAEVMAFAKDNDLFAVTMPVRRAFSSSHIQDLKLRGVYIYAHTINHIEVLKYLRAKGVYGVYTDRLLPKDIHQ